MTPVVAVLGLGAMGLPIAGRLAERWETRGYDVFDERAALAQAEGVLPAASPAAAVTGATHVVVVVRDAEQLESVLFGTHGAATAMTRGSVVIVTSTVGAAAVVEVARRLRERDIEAVDAPLSGGAVRARVGDLLITAGGGEVAMTRAREVLAAMASSVVVVGDVGDGQNMKTVNQLLCGVHTAAAAEALALADAMGLDLERCLDVLGRGAAASFMLQDRGPRMVQQLRGEVPDLRSRVDVIAKDMGIVGELARRHRVPTAVALAAENLYRMAGGAGLGAEDDSVVAAYLAGTDAGEHTQTPRRLP